MCSVWIFFYTYYVLCNDGSTAHYKMVGGWVYEATTPNKRPSIFPTPTSSLVCPFAVCCA